MRARNALQRPSRSKNSPADSACCARFSSSQRHLRHVAAVRGREIGARAGAAVGGHHREEELVRLGDGRRRDLLDVRAGGRRAARRRARRPRASRPSPARRRRRRRSRRAGRRWRRRGSRRRWRGADERIDPVAARDHARASSARSSTDRAIGPIAAMSSMPGLARRRPAAGLGHEPRARAQADDAAVVAGHADRAAAVGADARAASRRRRSAPPRRRSSRPTCARVERVERPPVQHRLGLVRPHVLGHRRLREHDRARAPARARRPSRRVRARCPRAPTEPERHGSPATASESLIVIGRPSSGPSLARGAPAIGRRPRRAAPARRRPRRRR